MCIVLSSAFGVGLRCRLTQPTRAAINHLGLLAKLPKNNYQSLSLFEG
ncbi:hypothetical protein MICAF_2300006 [Microcystis aeruginosa PCC 9807]|uniref:Uncharacterized protein n=1 Tax=Microcystis aeruginosa PCC 9807 TaxID=1160283 RepID=I4H4A8_MICAE|nr:hypothetical protein MICAF_2300006 [Microcystis aeruginosa PCC 9807]